MTNALSPTLMGVCDTPGWALNVAVAGSTVHVADGADGLRVVDVSDPANPHEVGAHEIPGLARRVAVAGSTAYVADMQGGLRAVDVADPAHPAQVGLYSLLADARRVAVSDGYVYVAAGLSGMRVVDIFDPSHPTQVGIYDTGGAYATSVVVSGTYAYLGSGSHYPNLHVVDISNPAHPTRISAIRTGECREIALAGQIVYCAGEGLQSINVSDPTAPALVGSILFEAVGVTVSETLAYVAGGGDGVKIVDVSNPVSPTLVGVYDFPGNEFTEGVTVSGNKAYVAEASAGLRIVDVSNPAAPVGIGFYDTPGVPSSVAISGTLAFVSDGGGGVQMVDVSNPITPTLVGAYDTPGFAWYTVVNGDYMYVADGSGGLLILERVDARAFARAGTVPSSSGNGSLASPVLVDITATSVVGTAPAGATVEIFSDQADEGWVYEGTVTAMASGAFTFIKTGGLTGPSVTATATDVTGNTSEFSALAIAFTTTYVVTSTLDSGPGSLRQALLDASQGDAIIFDPVAFPPASPATISLASQLPFLTQGQLTVDASNAGVLLDGNGTPAGTVGLLVDSDGNTIKGIQVLHFPSSGILLTANASHNTIGGDRTVGIGPTGEGNVISANGPWSGLLIDGSDNIVQGNLVGTDAAGSVAMGNAVCGIQLEVPGNIVGGIAAGRGNVVSGNEVGINIQGTGATSNTIIGNFIGTNISGTLALGNSRGVQIAGRASHNRVGGTTPEERNIISGNDQGVGIGGPGVEGNAVVGNYIGTDINGLGALGNNSGVVIECGASHNVVGGRNPGERNVISGNRGAGVVISDLGTTHNTVIGNYIGTDATGTAALGNHIGASTWGSGFNRIGGTEEGERNVISGNDEGIVISGKDFWLYADLWG